MQAASTTSKWSSYFLSQFMACLAGVVLALWLFGDYAFPNQADSFSSSGRDHFAINLDEESFTVLTRLSEEAFVELATIWSASSSHQDDHQNVYGDLGADSPASYLAGLHLLTASPTLSALQQVSQPAGRVRLSQEPPGFKRSSPPQIRQTLRLEGRTSLRPQNGKLSVGAEPLLGPDPPPRDLHLCLA